MSETSLEFFSGILLVSENPERLATFYRDVLDLPLEEERHGDTLPHWGCNVGDIHFAIHPIDDFPDHRVSGVGAVKLAFTVFDAHAAAAKLEARGVELLYPPKDTGFLSASRSSTPTATSSSSPSLSMSGSRCSKSAERRGWISWTGGRP